MLKDGSSIAEFGGSCAECPQRSQCTTSKSGRTIRLHAKHATLDRHRKRQRDEAWKKQYRKVRPRVERKIGHLMRRKHGGRRKVRTGARTGQARLRPARGEHQPRAPRRPRHPHRAHRDGGLTEPATGFSAAQSLQGGLGARTCRIVLIRLVVVHPTA
ncbi:MAG: transposase [Acidobacteriota bacterium]|nr:transposase [Acidobacteriota bacterium]